jgi:serine/threonine protein phosphatase PrpC
MVVYDGRKGIFTCANVGDSRCILSRGGRAVKLHRLHRLSEVDERERIIAAGGTVLKSRVNGVLAISRAFGDIEFKGSNPLHGLVISVPDIHIEKITPMTEFAILATDGVFDVMEPQDAVNIVRARLHERCSLLEAAQALTQAAINAGSVDNVTAAIILFNTSKV